MASSTGLGHLKFMQRAKLRDEEKKKKALADEEESAKENEWKILKCPGNKCIVIVEGDPLPGAPSGRMSFGGSNSSAETTKSLDSQKAIGDHGSSEKPTTSS